MAKFEISKDSRRLLENLILVITKEEFPDVALLAISGDQLSMVELHNKFISKANELINLKRRNDSILFLSIGVFWADKYKQAEGFKCPKCGSTDTSTAYENKQDFYSSGPIPKGGSQCFNCGHKWIHLF